MPPIVPSLWSDQAANLHAVAFDYFPGLKRVHDHFQENYSQPFSLADAAEIAYLEAKYFGKMFRLKMGCGFKEWTGRVRIARAIDTMQGKHQSLTDIAFGVGFQDLRTFERAFKKYTGLTPREFRKEVVLQMEPRLLRIPVKPSSDSN